MGVSLDPNCYIYLERDNANNFKLFSSFSDSNVFRNNDGEEIKKSEVLLNIMEASESAYCDRKDKYEIT